MSTRLSSSLGFYEFSIEYYDSAEKLTNTSLAACKYEVGRLLLAGNVTVYGECYAPQKIHLSDCWSSTFCSVGGNTSIVTFFPSAMSGHTLSRLSPMDRMRFDALALANSERSAYGLRYGDNHRYRKHCANKTHRLRARLNSGQPRRRAPKQPQPPSPSEVTVTQ